jgi:site-specific DNA-methyltransferase (adenine-specific)
MPEINLYNLDCMEGVKKYPDKYFDMILEDMPYGTTACKWDRKVDLGRYWESRLRIIKDNGAIVLTASQPFTTDLINSNRDMFKYELVWYKDRPADFGNANVKPLRYHENILVFYSKTPTYNKQFEKRKGGGNERSKYPVNYKQKSEHKFGMKSATLEYKNIDRCIGTVIEKTTGNRGHLIHPTQKSTELFEHLIKTYTNEGDKILDGFGGSGTTAIACLNTNRNCETFELDKDYFEAMMKRFENHKKQLTIDFPDSYRNSPDKSM